MTGLAMEIRHNFGADSPLTSRNGIAGYARRRWRCNTVKSVQAEWDLTEDEARGVVYARASQATLDKVWKHKRGGWSVALEVMADVIGCKLDEHLARKAAEYDRRFAAIEAERARNERLREALSSRDADAGRWPRLVHGGDVPAARGGRAAADELGGGRAAEGPRPLAGDRPAPVKREGRR